VINGFFRKKPPLIKRLIRRYVEFYLDLIATSETVSLLHHLAAKAKTVRDADPQTESEVCLMTFLLLG
jgi:hypothetical protein